MRALRVTPPPAPSLLTPLPTPSLSLSLSLSHSFLTTSTHTSSFWLFSFRRQFLSDSVRRIQSVELWVMMTLLPSLFIMSSYLFSNSIMEKKKKTLRKLHFHPSSLSPLAPGASAGPKKKRPPPIPPLFSTQPGSSSTHNASIQQADCTMELECFIYILLFAYAAKKSILGGGG